MIKDKKKKKTAPKDPADASDQTAPVLFEDMETDDLEVQIHQAIVRREKRPGGHPRPEDVEVMEEVVHRLLGAAATFTDLARRARDCVPVRVDGLVFLSFALEREAVRLYRLYTGRDPECG